MMKKILVVKIGAIGDVVMALPMLQYLKNQKKTTHITWICGNSSAPLLHKLSLIDDIIVVDEHKIFREVFMLVLSSYSPYIKKLPCAALNKLLLRMSILDIEFLPFFLGKAKVFIL